MLKFTLTVAVLSMTAMLVLSNSGALAQDGGDEPGMGGLTEMTEVPQDIPHDTTNGGGDADEPLSPSTPGHEHRGDDTPSETEGPQGNGGNGGNGGSNSDTIPVASMYCVYTANLDGTYPGAYMTNTGNVTWHVGTTILFHLASGDVLMTVAMDVLPGGQWAFMLDYDDYPWMEFPAGTELPMHHLCDAELTVA